MLRRALTIALMACLVSHASLLWGHSLSDAPQTAKLVIQRLTDLKVAYEAEDIKAFLNCFSTSQFDGFEKLKSTTETEWKEFDFEVTISSAPPPIVSVTTRGVAAAVHIDITRFKEGKFVSRKSYIALFRFGFRDGAWLITHRQLEDQQVAKEGVE